ncbi:MAG: hypothetical protein ACLQLG_07425 [Thermoguttaceae bacterium]
MLADRYEVRVKLSAGPFAVDDAQPTILRKTQLTTENDTSEKE